MTNIVNALEKIERAEIEVKQIAKDIAAKEKDLSRRMYKTEDMFATPEESNQLFNVAIDTTQPQLLIKELKLKQKRAYSNYLSALKELELLKDVVQEKLF